MPAGGSKPEYIEEMKKLIEKGADVNASDCSGETLIYIASKRDYLVVVILLLKSGADPDKPCNGKTAIDIATLYGHGEVVQLLKIGVLSHPTLMSSYFNEPSTGFR